MKMSCINLSLFKTYFSWAHNHWQVPRQSLLGALCRVLKHFCSSCLPPARGTEALGVVVVSQRCWDCSCPCLRCRARLCCYCSWCCSVAQLWPHRLKHTGSSILHYVPEFVQTHVLWVGGAIQSSCLLLPPSPFAFNFSQHLGASHPGGLEVKVSASNVGDLGSSPGSGRSPGEGNGNLLQYPCLKNPMDRGTWRATVHRATKTWTWLKQKKRSEKQRRKGKILPFECRVPKKSKER